MFDFLIAWSLRNRLIVLLLFSLLGGAAIIALQTMPLDVFPEFAPPQVQIQTEAPGYSAKDVELLVTRQIETALQGMPDVEQIRSSSSIGLSRITVIFQSGIDVYRARLITQERVQLAQGSLPAGIEPPQLMPVTSAVSWLLKFALVDWSEQPKLIELRSLADWEFRNRIVAQPGVASVVAIGGGVKQYLIEPDPLKLNAFNVPFASLVEAARAANSVAAGAYLYPSDDEEYFVRVNGLARDPAELAASHLLLRSRVPITLGDLAQVSIGEEIKRGDAQIEGEPAIIGTVSKQWGADTLETTRRVEQVLAALSAQLPAGVELIPNVFRQATFIEKSVANLQEALLHASLIVAVILFLFLFHWRPTAVSLVAIPASLMVGILVLYLSGIGINALTLGGLVLAIGEVVDDAIIDVENILRRLREAREEGGGLDAGKIVFEGSREIRNSVVFATLIVAIAFTPAILLDDIEGRIFAPLAFAYLAAVGCSLFVALTLVPVLCYYMAGSREWRGRYRVGIVARRLTDAYRGLLEKSIEYPLAMTGVGIGAALVALILVAGLGRSFIPAFNEGNIVISTTMMPGTSLDENLRLGKRIEEAVGSMPEVELITQRAGRSRLDEDAQPVNFAEFDVTLRDEVENTAAVIQEIRQRLSTIPGVAVNVSQFITHRMQEILSGVRAQVSVKIFGPDIEELVRKQQELLAAVQGVEGIVDLQAEPLILAPGLDIQVDRTAAARYGFAPGEIVRQVGQAFNGVVVSKVLEHDRSFDVVVRISRESMANPETMGQFPLTSRDGVIVPLREVAALKPVFEPYMVNRDNGARRTVVQWNVEGRDLDGVVSEAREKIEEQVSLAPGYTIEFGGDYVGQERSTRSLLVSGFAATLLIFAVMLMAFRRIAAVMLVMSNLPFALVGGVFALAVAGETLNVSSLVGLIALFGIATRNSILLVSRYRTLSMERPRETPQSVAIEGAVERMLPIVMTALTTALAVTPFLFGDAAGKELERPLAIVLLGGMVSSTLLNLFVVPAGYLLMRRNGVVVHE